MSKSITKQAFWAVFAALFAALMALALAPAPSTAYASDLTAGGVSAQANPVKLVVFENNELAARTFSESTKVKKTYSQSDLEALAAKNKKAMRYAYAQGSNNFGMVYESTSYVFIKDLLADAGVSISDNEWIMFAVGTYDQWASGEKTLDEAVYKEGKGGQPYPGIYGSDLSADMKFFPNHGQERNSKDPLSAMAIYSLAAGSGAIGPGETAKDVKINEHTSFGDVFNGLTVANYEESGLPGGFNHPGKVWGIVVVHRTLIDGATIAAIPDQTYTGSAIEPTVTVKFEGGEALKAGTDYAVAYSNNIEPGTATVTVTGKGDYSGTVTANFTIKDTVEHASNINTKKVTAAQIQAAAALGATKVTLGKNVKSIEPGAFANTNIRTVNLASTKLTKKGVKNALKGSKVKTIKVKIKATKSTKGLTGKAKKKVQNYNKKAKKTNAKYVKKYKKFFTKANCGKKGVKVK